MEGPPSPGGAAASGRAGSRRRETAGKSLEAQRPPSGGAGASRSGLRSAELPHRVRCGAAREASVNT